jgi:hypothetical protein
LAAVSCGSETRPLALSKLTLRMFQMELRRVLGHKTVQSEEDGKTAASQSVTSADVIRLIK